MIGRYGIDKLWSVLLIFFFVIILLANAFYKVSKITYCAIEIMAFVLVVFAIFRVFSKNIEARRAENAKWLKFENNSSSRSSFKHEGLPPPMYKESKKYLSRFFIFIS
mgnify:CR=1 FL=1